jgi:hypothetical protein
MSAGTDFTRRVAPSARRSPVGQHPIPFNSRDVIRFLVNTAPPARDASGACTRNLDFSVPGS